MVFKIVLNVLLVFVISRIGVVVVIFWLICLLNLVILLVDFNKCMVRSKLISSVVNGWLRKFNILNSIFWLKGKFGNFVIELK